MSSICGYWCSEDSSVRDSTIHDMLLPLNHWKADKEGFWSEGAIAFGHLMLYNTPESLTETLPYYDAASKCCITADARIDNREDLAEKLSLDPKTAKDKADSWYILSAYEKWGEDCTQYLEGDFAFAIWDKDNEKIFCARDQIGIKPFYYYFKDGLFAFATEIKGILAIETIGKTINEKWIVGFIVNITEESRSSVYKNIHRLEAAHQISLTDQKINIKKYWELDTTTKIYFANESDYVEAFLEKLDQAISKRLRSNWRITAELSGGLDSSLIIALAQKSLQAKGQEIITISDLMPEHASKEDPMLLDDRELVIMLIKYLGIKDFHFTTGEERTFVDSLNRIIEIQDEPTKKTLNIFADLIYEKAESLNSRVILSGFGGNDFVSQPGDFFHEELFRTGKWQTMWREIKLNSKRHRASPYGSLVNVILSSFLSVYSSQYKYIKLKYINRSYFRLAKNRYLNTGIHPELSKKYGLDKRLIKLKYSNRSGKTMNEKMGSRLNEPGLFSDRLEYCNLSTAHNRVEYRYPLFDVPLLEFFLSIPSTEKIKNGWSRYLYRKASKGLVPEELIWGKAKASSPTPSFLWRMFRDKKLIIDSLEALPKESDIHQYMDVKSYMKRLRENAGKRRFNNYGGSRLFLLQHFLDGQKK